MNELLLNVWIWFGKNILKWPMMIVFGKSKEEINGITFTDSPDYLIEIGNITNKKRIQKNV